MKTKISQIATVTFFSLIILVGNVYADGTETSVLSNKNTEEALEIEDWMINDSVWNAYDIIFLDMETAFMAELEIALEVEVEDALEVENWMVNDETFRMEQALMMELEAALEIETEEALEIENWMINDKNFDTPNIIKLESETEQALELESWMTDNRIWNK